MVILAENAKNASMKCLLLQVSRKSARLLYNLYADFVRFLSNMAQFFASFVKVLQLARMSCYSSTVIFNGVKYFSASLSLDSVGTVCYDMREMKRYLIYTCAVAALLGAELKAELAELEQVLAYCNEEVTKVQFALRHYEAMFLLYQDDPEGPMRSYLLTDEQAAELAQALVPLRVAERFTDDEPFPCYLLRFVCIDGEVIEFELDSVEPEGDDAFNYCLPLVEYCRMQGVVEEVVSAE